MWNIFAIGRVDDKALDLSGVHQQSYSKEFWNPQSVLWRSYKVEWPSWRREDLGVTAYKHRASSGLYYAPVQLI